MSIGVKMEYYNVNELLENGWTVDPGLPNKTGFYYPTSWNDKLGKWPSLCGLQVEYADHYVQMFKKGLLTLE